MSTKTIVFNLLLGAALIAAAGCASNHNTPATVVSDSSRMQGAWTGHERGADQDAAASHFIIAGNNFEFRGSDANEWYKGTFTLKEDANPKQILITVKECSAPQYVGQASHGIYKFDGAKLIITAREPGTPDMPAAFDEPGARCIDFTK